jgi:hypothetical protein
MDLIVNIFAIYGLAFLLKESDGPWGTVNWFRRTLFGLPYGIGVFFIKLFDCYFCLGCHCGWIVYLLYRAQLFIILWLLAGGAISLILDGVLSRLHRE